MIRFFLVTGKQYAALDSPDPEAIYFIRDEHRIQTAGVDFASGISGFGHVIGGYPAAVASYSNTEDAVSVTLKAAADGEDMDMTKYLPGGDIWFNICSDADQNTEELLFQKRTILAVDTGHATLTLDAPLENSNVTEIIPSRLFCMVPDRTRKDNASASGDKNFVAGMRAHANGSWNTVTGFCASVGAGAENIVNGNFSAAYGINNIVARTLALAVGDSNKVDELSSVVIGTGNTAGNQEERIFGSTNTVSAINSNVIGNVNSVTGYRTVVIGDRNNADGQGGISIGTGLKNHASHAVMIGHYGELEAAPENKNAVVIAGGSEGKKNNIVIFRSWKAALNPEYEQGTSEEQYLAVPACRTTFRGQFTPMTGEISADSEGNAVLDADLYSRWKLSGEGSVNISLVNAVDGDRIELILDSTSITPVFPESWIGAPDVTSQPGICLLEIAVIGDKVFCGKRFPQ